MLNILCIYEHKFTDQDVISTFRAAFCGRANMEPTTAYRRIRTR